MALAILMKLVKTDLGLSGKKKKKIDKIDLNSSKV